MSPFPSGITRVPNLLASQLTLRQVSGTNVSLLKLQEQLSTMKRVNAPSDDPAASTIIDKLNRQLAQSSQQERNLSNASSTLSTLDQLVSQMSDSVLNAQSIASSQVGAGSDAQTRSQQASVVDSIISGVVSGLNQDYTGLYLFAGSATASAPIQYFNGGYKYTGSGDGLTTDLGGGIDFPITMGADAVAGAMSAKVTSSVDFNPALTASTNVSDLRGPAADKQLGTMDVTITNGGPPTTVTVDLSHAATLGDVSNAIESAIRAADPTALTGTYPGGVTVDSDRLGVHLAAGATISFSDSTSGSTATALGLSGFTFDSSNAHNPASGADLDPRLTDSTTLGSLFGGTGASTGDIVFRVGTHSGTVTTTPGMTIGQLKEAVRRLNIGARLDIDASGSTLDAYNEVSGLRMSIEEGATGGNAATSLGIRTLMTTTQVSSLNDGKGVEIADGVTNPTTGALDPSKNTDFQVTLSDGTSFSVDLVPGDMTSIQGVLNKINASAAAAGVSVGTGAGQFVATLRGAGGNGIQLSDTLGGSGTLGVTSLNGHAAEDLGLLDGASTAGNPAVLAGSDRSSVRVDGLLSNLIDLRNALSANDSDGITLAGSRLDGEVDRLASARALVGSRTQRVEEQTTNLQSQDTLSKSVRSKLEDLDVVEASGSLSLLQTQLQAGLTAAAQTRQLTLLNFLSA